MSSGALLQEQEELLRSASEQVQQAQERMADLGIDTLRRNSQRVYGTSEEDEEEIEKLRAQLLEEGKRDSARSYPSDPPETPGTARSSEIAGIRDKLLEEHTSPPRKTGDQFSKQQPKQQPEAKQQSDDAASDEPEDAEMVKFHPGRQVTERKKTKVVIDMKLSAKGNKYGCILCKDMTLNQRMMLKKSFYYESNPEVYSEEIYRQTRQQALARLLVGMFCRDSPGSCQPTFLQRYAYVLLRRADAPVVLVEELVEGVYDKRPLRIFPETETEPDVVESHKFSAFSFWHYQNSERGMVLLRACRVGNRWTEPEFHSGDKSVGGKSDLGMEGIQNWWEQFAARYCPLLKVPEEELLSWSPARLLIEFNQRGFFEGSSKRVIKEMSPKPTQKQTPPVVVPLVETDTDENLGQDKEPRKPVPDATGEQQAEELNAQAEAKANQTPVAATFIPERDAVPPGPVHSAYSIKGAVKTGVQGFKAPDSSKSVAFADVAAPPVDIERMRQVAGGATPASYQPQESTHDAQASEAQPSEPGSWMQPMLLGFHSVKGMFSGMDSVLTSRSDEPSSGPSTERSQPAPDPFGGAPALPGPESWSNPGVSMEPWKSRDSVESHSRAMGDSMLRPKQANAHFDSDDDEPVELRPSSLSNMKIRHKWLEVQPQRYVTPVVSRVLEETVGPRDFDKEKEEAERRKKLSRGRPNTFPSLGQVFGGESDPWKKPNSLSAEG